MEKKRVAALKGASIWVAASEEASIRVDRISILPIGLPLQKEQP